MKAPRSSFFNSFVILHILVECIRFILRFRLIYLRDYRLLGKYLKGYLFECFLEDVKKMISNFFSPKAFLGYWEDLIFILRIWRFEALSYIEETINELFIIKAILPRRLLSYFLAMFIMLFMILYHEYISNIRAYEMMVLKEWSDANEAYRFPATQYWWHVMCDELSLYYKSWLIVINLYFWPSIFFVRVFRWMSVNFQFISLFWFAWYTAKFEPYIWIVIHYVFSEWCWGYYPSAAAVYILGHFGQWGMELEEEGEWDGTDDEELKWEKVEQIREVQKFWYKYEQRSFYPPLMPLADLNIKRKRLEKLLEDLDEKSSRYDKVEISSEWGFYEVVAEVEFHPLATDFRYAIGSYSRDPAIRHMWPKGTEVWDDEDPWRVTQEFVSYITDNNERYFKDQITEDMDRHTRRQYEEDLPLIADIIDEIETLYSAEKVNYATSSIFRDLGFYFTLLENDMELLVNPRHILRFTPVRTMWYSIPFAIINQFIVFRYFRYMRGVVGPFSPYHPTFDLISYYLRNKERLDLRYWYKRGALRFFHKKLRTRAFSKIAKSIQIANSNHKLTISGEQKFEHIYWYTAKLMRKPRNTFFFEGLYFYTAETLYKTLANSSKEPIKYYYLEESVSDYLETLYVTTFTRYVLKSLWLSIKRFFRWLHPVNWWKRRKNLKVLLRFEKESRVLLKKKRKNFKFFMIDKSSIKKTEESRSDKHEYPNEDVNVKNK